MWPVAAISIDEPIEEIEHKKKKKTIINADKTSNCFIFFFHSSPLYFDFKLSNLSFRFI